MFAILLRKQGHENEKFDFSAEAKILSSEDIRVH